MSRNQVVKVSISNRSSPVTEYDNQPKVNENSQYESRVSVISK